MNIISLKDLYSYKQKSYAWESFYYQVPKTFFHNQANKNAKNKTLLPKKDHYPDKFVQESTKYPGPTQYNPSQVKSSSKTCKINQRDRLTIMTQMEK